MAISDSIPVLIYTRYLSSRLRYTLDYIFGYRLGIRYEVTDSIERIKQSSAFTINYSDIPYEADLTIIPHPLLGTQGIKSVALSLNRWKRTFIVFYNQPGAKVPFDIFSAVFYFISRYEEYLPFTPDQHGRFPAALSLAGSYSFLQQPVVDLWLLHFQEILAFPVNPSHQSGWDATIDVDMIWKYLNKKPSVQRWGILKDMVKLNLKGLQERNQVLRLQKPDPFDCFGEIQSCMGKDIRYFILTSPLTRFDRNTDPENPGFQHTIKAVSNGRNIGIHPSYYSVAQMSIRNEMQTLKEITGQAIHSSRQHFIRLSFPHTYHQLIEAGIREDFTMGYPESNGFRAGTSLPFYWYDLSKEESTQLFVHPFVYMDATQLFYGRRNHQEQLSEMEHIARQIKNSQGRFVGIWHNYIIGDQLAYPQQLDLLKKSVALLNRIFPSANP